MAELKERRRELKSRVDSVRNEKLSIEVVEKAKKKRALNTKEPGDDQDFLIGDYESDEENGATSTVNTLDINSNLSKEVQALLAKYTHRERTITYSQDLMVFFIDLNSRNKCQIKRKTMMIQI